MDYCSVVWRQLTLEQKKMVETIQNIGMRIILGVPRSVTGTAIREKLQWTTLAQRRRLSYALKLAYKCIHWEWDCMVYLHNKFQSISSLTLRQTKRVFLRKTISRTEFYNKSFEYFTAKLWNSLPSPIITLTDIGPFTRAKPHGDVIFITEGGGRACNCQQAESPTCTKNRTHLPTSSQFHNLRPHVHLALVQTLYHR